MRYIKSPWGEGRRRVQRHRGGGFGRGRASGTHSDICWLCVLTSGSDKSAARDDVALSTYAGGLKKGGGGGKGKSNQYARDCPTIGNGEGKAETRSNQNLSNANAAAAARSASSNLANPLAFAAVMGDARAGSTPGTRPDANSWMNDLPDHLEDARDLEDDPSLSTVLDPALAAGQKGFAQVAEIYDSDTTRHLSSARERFTDFVTIDPWPINDASLPPEWARTMRNSQPQAGRSRPCSCRRRCTRARWSPSPRSTMPGTSFGLWAGSARSTTPRRWARGR